MNNVDAFVGIFAEKHAPGSELGATALAIWAKQFQALRDGDRFYFGNDQGLSMIKSTYGIDYRHTLAQIIEMNSDETAANLNVTGNVFMAPDASLPATGCSVDYDPNTNAAGNAFTASVVIKNTSSQTVAGWRLNFELSQGQKLQSESGILLSQSGSNGMNWTGTDNFFDRVIPAGQSLTVSFTASRDIINQKPVNFTLNGHRCAVK
jgi:hypothetical protein